MKSIAIKTALVLSLIFCPQSLAAPEATLDSRAQDISHLFCEKPGGYDQIFAPSFRSAIPDEKVTAILKEVFAQAGKCTNVIPDKNDPGAFQLNFEKGAFTTIHIAIDPGLPLSAKQWDYIAFKGGSEPGVINLTYLLHASGPGDRWFVVAATWNNPDKPVDESAFEELIRKVIESIH